MKKFLLIAALCLTAAVLLCGCNTTTPGIPEKDPVDFQYTTYFLEDGEFVTLTKYVGEKTDVVVPAELDGLTVTEIGANCFAESAVVSVTVPDSVIVIESGAFSKCTALTSVTLPDKMLYVGPQAFAECSSLKEITLPSTGITEYSASLFLGSAVEKVILPEGMEIIPASTFFASNLKEITLPSTVKRVDDNAFAGCANLVSVKLNEGLTSIGDYVFMSCTSLTEIVIPASVETLTESAFIRCNSLSKVMFEGNATDFKVEGATYAEEPTYTVYCHEGAEGFDADKWEGFTVEFW